MSPDPLPVPGHCRQAYDRYAADLGRSALAASTRTYRARCVRRFLRWLPANTTDVGAVLTQPTAWHIAATRFTAELAAAAGTLSADAQSHRNALADCARRLGLAEPYVAVPERFRWVHDAYTAAAPASGQSEATRISNLSAVRAFLRWLDQASYTGDLRRDWTTATTSYLQHLTGKGNAPSSVLRQRAALNHCATCVALPRSAADARRSRPKPGANAADRLAAEATVNGAGRHT